LLLEKRSLELLVMRLQMPPETEASQNPRNDGPKPHFGFFSNPAQVNIRQS
jgi:hypothetical protein